MKKLEYAKEKMLCPPPRRADGKRNNPKRGERVKTMCGWNNNGCIWIIILIIILFCCNGNGGGCGCGNSGGCGCGCDNNNGCGCC